MVAQRQSFNINLGESGVIVVNNIETIKFDTRYDDGFLGLINVKMDGVNQAFYCVDCTDSSSSMELGRLYLDLYMNGYELKKDLPETAYCLETCTFRRGSRPTIAPGKFNPHCDHNIYSHNTI